MSDFDAEISAETAFSLDNLWVISLVVNLSE